MRKLLMLLSALIIVNMSMAQVSVSDSLKIHYHKIYQQALQYNDINTCISALHNIIAETPGDNKLLLKDTLAMLYFATKSYYSSLLLSKEVYKSNSANVNALARAAECYQNLGETKNAITDYETVTPLLKNPYYYYQLAVCQYGLKRTAECEITLGKVLADSNSNKTAVTFVLPNGNEQQVPASAAALNMAAIMRLDLKNYSEAKNYLENALKLYPEFEGAKQNLNFCNENLKGTKPTTKTVPKGKG